MPEPASAPKGLARGKPKKSKRSLACAMDVDAVMGSNGANDREGQVSNSVDAHGGQCVYGNLLPENSKECVMSVQGDPSQKVVGLVQNNSEQIGKMKAAGKRKKRARNKKKKISNIDGAGEKSVGETEGAGSKMCTKSNVNSASNKEGALENAGIDMNPKNAICEKDPNYHGVKKTDSVEKKYQRRQKNGEKNLSASCSSSHSPEENKKPKEGNSPDNGSLHGNSEGNKKSRKRRKREKKNSLNKSISQGLSLPADAGNALLTTMAAENSMPGRKRKGSRKKKRNKNGLAATSSLSVHDVKREKGGSNADVVVDSTVDSVIEKKDVVIPPDVLIESIMHGVVEKKDAVTPSVSFEDKEVENGTKSLGSLMHDSKEVPQLVIVEDAEVSKNHRANCRQHPSSCEKVCQNALAGIFTNQFDDGSMTGTSEGSRKMGPVERRGKASLPPSPIRGVIEDPMELQHNQFHSSSEEGASFSFRVGEKASDCRPESRGYVKTHGSSSVEHIEHGMNTLGCTKNIGSELQAISTDRNLDCVSSSSVSMSHYEKIKDVYSPKGSLIRFRRKKLLILDLNGLLADINQDYHNAHKADAKVRGKLVFKRPYYSDFLKFCFANFELGIWSSRKKENVDSVVDILMRDLKHNLLFCWDISKCTVTGLKTLENMHKPLVLKELKKLWNKEEPDLPWEHGEYSPSNTLLVDDSPYKALRNPPHTAIFPYPYSYHNRRDNSLGRGGDLRMYLEAIAVADDVEQYVREHPFGQPSITESDPQWNFYEKIVDKVENTLVLN